MRMKSSKGKQHNWNHMMKNTWFKVEGSNLGNHKEENIVSS
jgi:hypothetical protein